jgi:hypothetical protein
LPALIVQREFDPRSFGVLMMVCISSHGSRRRKRASSP